MATFVIHAAPGTDIWRKPPHTDVFNAPTAVSPALDSTSGPLKDFVSARVSFSFDWSERYDQAGLLICLRKQSGDSGQDSSTVPDKWVKSGVEFYNGKPMLSTVACDAWADWSVAPLADDGTSHPEAWTTVSAEKEEDEHGVSIWVYRVLGNSEKVPLREITWVFGHDPDQCNIEVWAMAARPETKAVDDLKVSFKNMEIMWRSDSV